MDRAVYAFFVSLQLALTLWLQLAERGRLAAVMILAIALVPGFKLRLRRSAHLLTLVVAAMLFACLAYFDFCSPNLDLNAPQVFAEFLLVVQALEFLGPPRSRDNNYLPGIGAITVGLLLLALDQSLPIRDVTTISTIFMVATIFVLRPDFFSLLISNRVGRHKASAIIVMSSCIWIVGVYAYGELALQLPAIQKSVQELRGIEIEQAAD